jgi:LemA protein
MDQFEDKLNKHIDKVLELQRQKETKPLSLQELKEVDLSLGMTDEEWDAMMQKVEDYVQMANSHMQYGNYIEAYKAAESAVSINPYHQQGLLLLANAALGKYESDQKDEFIVKAQEHANELLKVNPKQQTAIQILAKVRSYLNTENTQKKNIVKYGAIVLIVVLIVAGYFILKPAPAPKENTELKNQLIEAEEAANSAWAQVENVIERRNQLIPQLLELAPESNSEAINIKSEIDELKKKLETSSGVDEKMKLNNQLQEKLKLLTNSINSASANKKTELILVQIEGSYNRISVEAKRYNDAVRNFNVMVKKFGNQFPEFKEKPYFLGK